MKSVFKPANATSPVFHLLSINSIIKHKTDFYFYIKSVNLKINRTVFPQMTNANW